MERRLRRRRPGPGRPRPEGQPRFASACRVRPRIAELDELHLAAERQGRSTFVLVTAVPRTQPSAHALRSEYKHPRSLERRSASLKDPEVVDPFFLQKPERAQALGYVPLMVCLIFRALARRVRQTAAPLATIARGPVVHRAGLEVLRRLAATVVRLPDAARGLRVAPALRPTCDAILQRCRVPVAAYTPLPPSPRPPPGSPPDAEIRNGGPRRAEYAPRGVSSAEARAAAREARPPPPRPHGPFGARRAGGRRLGQDAAGSHAAWQGEARRLFARIPALLARYGLAAGAELRLADDPATPYSYYDRERGVIGASLPDAGTPAGRLFWLFLTALLEVSSEAEALAFGRWLLVYVLGHETGHHLRHRYGADTADRWLEEHVANELGLGLALLFPRFRRQLPTMAALVFRAAGRLGALGGPHLAWAHRDLGETLLATGILDEETLRQAERLAREAGLPPEAVLEAAGVPAEALRTAERERAEVAAHLRNAYLSDLMEYGAFHLTWLADLLRQPELPDLGTSAATHLLTPAWEDRRRHAARLFLRRTITADTPAAAGAVAALAREADNAELAWLVAAYPQRTPDVQAAILRALVPRPPVPALVTACERLLADGGGGGLRAAAALYLLRHRPQALRSAAAGSVWRALADGPGAARAAGRPPRALVAEPEAALPALREAVAAVPERLEGLPVAAWMRPLLRHDDAAVRIAALGVLAEPAVAGQRDGLHGLAQAVAGLAGSARAGERRAALAVLEQ